MSETYAGSRVLITGATGFLGGRLAHRLKAEGTQVVATVRSPAKAVSLQADGIEVTAGDVTDRKAMIRAAAGCDLVFHVAAAFEGVEQTYGVNVEGSRNLAVAAVEAGAKRVIFVSSIAVYGFNYRRVLHEDLPYGYGAYPYAITKALGETAVIEVAQQYATEYTIIRPGMIYGAGSINWTDNLFKVARRSPVLFVGDGSGSAYPIYVDDVVDLLVTAGTHPAAANEIFNCAPDPAPTWREWLLAYAALAGHQNYQAIPPILLSAMAGIAMLVAPRQHMLRDLPDIIAFLQAYTPISIDKARALLGWSPQIDLETGVASCADYLRAKDLL